MSNRELVLGLKTTSNKLNELLTDLNPAQKQAVTYGEGPLLVVAGAGTGKTTVITRRIAWLINQQLAKPAEILALTFTEKAAGEMETRVDQLLPYGMTDTCIATFHAFGDQLLREHAIDLGLPPEFRILGEAEQELFLAERFDVIDPLHELRPVTNPRKYVSTILKVIGRAKDELVTPERYQSVADKLLKAATTDEERRVARRQADIATIYAAYETFKAEAGVIDFGDQILLLYEFLQREPTALTRLRQRFRFILVDEFQDTNIAQYQLVKLLLRESHNLTVVGDDDQAIYKFRGAAVSNIVGFLKDFPSAQTVVLTENYRSSQLILDAAYRLIRHNDPDRLESQLNISKKLVGQSTGTKPTIHWYAHEHDELTGLTNKISGLRKTIPLPEIAILVRSNQLIRPIAGALRQATIPYTTSSDRDFQKLPEIRGMSAFFQALVHPSDSLAHVKLAFSPYYQLQPETILAINDVARKTHQSFHDILDNEAGAAWQRIKQAELLKVRELRDDLTKYRQLIASKRPADILYAFLKNRGFLETPNPQLPVPSPEKQLSLFTQKPEEERLEMIQNVAAVFEAIKQWTDAQTDPFTLTFVDQLDRLLTHVVPPSVDLGPDVPAVRLMTVHAAKGLEFQAVFLPYLTSDRFPARRRAAGLELPAELIAETLPSGDEHLEEERRLAYVAMTRAKSVLVLSGSEQSGEGLRLKKPSPFLMESLGLKITPNAISGGSAATRLVRFAPQLPIPTTISFPSENGTMFLSPAMIDTYIQDPYQFYWRYVLKAPQPDSRHLNYGNAIHSAIEAYYYLRRKKLTPEVEERSGKTSGVGAGDQDLLAAVLKRYHEAWQSWGFDSQRDEERQRAHGEETLKRFCARAAVEPLPSFVEETFTLHLPGVRIKGRMDAIFREKGEIRDFKTSLVKDQKEANRKIRDNIPIQIYALAYQKRFGEFPKHLVLDFVEHDLLGILEPSAELITNIRQIIADVVDGIRSGRFDPNPSNPFKDYE